LFYFAREAAGAAGARHSLRPLIFEGCYSCTPRAHRAAGSRTCILPSLLRRFPSRN